MTRHLSEAQRRKEIIDAACYEFVENGYLPTRMEDVARRAGLSKGGLYFHFASKRDLFLALVNQEYLKSKDVLERIRAEALPVFMKLEMLARHYPGYFATHPEKTRFFVVLCEAALHDEDLRELLRRINLVYLETIQDVLKEGILSGEVLNTDARAVAAMLKALMDGLQANMALGQVEDIEAVLNYGTRAVLFGVLNPKHPLHVTAAETPYQP